MIVDLHAVSRNRFCVPFTHFLNMVTNLLEDNITWILTWAQSGYRIFPSSQGFLTLSFYSYTQFLLSPLPPDPLTTTNLFLIVILLFQMVHEGNHAECDALKRAFALS